MNKKPIDVCSQGGLYRGVTALRYITSNSVKCKKMYWVRKGVRGKTLPIKGKDSFFYQNKIRKNECKNQ